MSYWESIFFSSSPPYSYIFSSAFSYILSPALTLISYAGSQYSVPAEYIGKDVAVVALDNMLAAYYEGKQIALHRISYQRKDMVVNPQHYRRLTLKQTIDGSNVLLEQDKVIDFPLKPSDLSRYDEVLYD